MLGRVVGVRLRETTASSAPREEQVGTGRTGGADHD